MDISTTNLGLPLHPLERIGLRLPHLERMYMYGMIFLVGIRFLNCICYMFVLSKKYCFVWGGDLYWAFNLMHILAKDHIPTT